MRRVVEARGEACERVAGEAGRGRWGARAVGRRCAGGGAPLRGRWGAVARAVGGHARGAKGLCCTEKPLVMRHGRGVWHG